jgi:hypothetical protein
MPAATELAVYETFEEVYGRRSTLDELTADISQFSQQSVLWVCAAIVTGMELWNKPDLQPFDIYVRFLSLFFDNALRARFIAGYSSTEPKRFLFHRRQVLLIAKLAILHCPGHGIDARFRAERFGPVLLKANDQLHYGLLPTTPGMRIADREDYAKIITEMVAVGEHASPHIAHMITRSHLMLTRFLGELRDDPDFIDVRGEYQSTTGLIIEEFEALIFGAHARFREVARKLIKEPGALPLRDANFSATAVSRGKVRTFLDSLASEPTSMAQELSKKDNGPNDFTIFRRFPLVMQYYNMHLRTASCGFLMMDNLFFLEKIQTAPYWNASGKFGEKLRKFWGSVFERYVNELMTRACSGSRSMFVPDPRPDGDPGIQICDGIVVAGDSIVIMEYKSNMFRADTKYSGNHIDLANELEKKLVHDKEADKKKGVWQLADAVNLLFGPKTQISVRGIDLHSIKHVYLYLVTLDSVGDTIGISPFLNTFLEEKLERTMFPKIEIRPLFCTDIESLETLTGFFSAATLPQILEYWFRINPSLTMPVSAIDLEKFVWQENPWLYTEWRGIYKGMVKVLFPNKDPDAALVEAEKRAETWRRYGGHV